VDPVKRTIAMTWTEGQNVVRLMSVALELRSRGCKSFASIVQSTVQIGWRPVVAVTG
jgi:hypothetical protein